MAQKTAVERISEAQVSRIDPHNMRTRLAAQTSRLLKFLEETPDEAIEVKPFLYSLIQMYRIEVLGVALRKEKLDEPNRGSSVRKYAAEFVKIGKTDGARRRAANTGEPEPEPESLESILDDEWGDDNIAAE